MLHFEKQGNKKEKNSKLLISTLVTFIEQSTQQQCDNIFIYIIDSSILNNFHLTKLKSVLCTWLSKTYDWLEVKTFQVVCNMFRNVLR